MRPERDALPLRHAVALGALHGPAELLPVSSSAHIALVPGLLGWRTDALAPDVHKAFEVALHTGTLGAMVRLVGLPSPKLALLGTVPAAIAGLTLEDPIERRLGGVRATAAGLIAGSALLLAADAIGDRTRECEDLNATDAVVLGLAQAVALVPGTSRLGMAVAAARLRGFSPAAAFALGRSAGLPLVAGATALKGVRLAQRGVDRRLRVPFVAGMAAAGLSTLAAAPLARRRDVKGPAIERVALALAALACAPRRRRTTA
jgi:undecaprenyl-diphosphatase